MTVTLRSYEPAELIPPGRTLAEWLEHAGMTQADFAKRSSLTAKHINQVVKGTVGISPEVALAFEMVTSIPSRYWLQLDANFQSAKQRLVETADLADHVGVVDRFPYAELERRGAVPAARTKVDKLRELLRFFGVADVHALGAVSMQPSLYRLSNAFEPSDAALASWLRLAEREAATIETAPFDLVACREVVGKMRHLSTLRGTQWLEPLRELSASVGIAVVVVKELPKCRVNGATRWLSPDKAMIAMSFRYRRNDVFWFTFFHELGHVIRHSKKETFIDSGASSGIEKKLEREADAFASRTLIPPADAARLPGLRTAEDVVAFAEEIGVAPGIVVGRMQHDNLIPQNRWTSMFDRYKFADD